MARGGGVERAGDGRIAGSARIVLSVRASEIRELIRMKPIVLDGNQRRLAACHDISDLRRVARRRIPRPVFDYVDGGADEELSMRANVAGYRSRRFLPRLLNDVTEVDTSAALLGRKLPLPLVLAPTGYTRMMHPDGEIGAARAAQRHDLPYTLSTMATTPIEQLAATASPDLWFQLYVQSDTGLTNELVDRAEAAGYRVLMVTLDTVVTGNRTRDKRNGLVIPPELTVQALASIAAHPGYWLAMLRSPAIGFANFAGHPTMTIEQSSKLFSAAITWDEIAALRERWKGKLLLKGPLGPADARRAAEAGVDGIQLSNHGGRQLDRTVPPVELIAGAREQAGQALAIIADSGIRHGADIAVATALGADAVAIGRAYLYGLMAGGEAGVDKAIDILDRQFRRTMQLLGVTSVEELRKRGRELLTG